MFILTRNSIPCESIKSLFALDVMTGRIKETMMHYSKYKPFKYDPTDSFTRYVIDMAYCELLLGIGRFRDEACWEPRKRIIQKHNEKNARGGNLMIKPNILRLKNTRCGENNRLTRLVPLCLAFSFIQCFGIIILITNLKNI